MNCKEKGCVFPAHEDCDGYCAHHYHMLQEPWAFERRTVTGIGWDTIHMRIQSTYSKRHGMHDPGERA
jgi:hypothetical protein